MSNQKDHVIGVLHKAATFDIRIGGAVYTLYNRTTERMLEIGDVRKVFGLLMSAKAEPTEVEFDTATTAYAELVSRAITRVVYAIDGVPVEGLGLTAEDLAPVADAVFSAFIRSGLNPDPIESSCKDPQEPS